MAPGGFEQVQGADGIGVKIIERNGGGAVMAGLGRRVDYGIRAKRLEQGANAGPVADVQFVMDECRQSLLEPLLVPAGVALRAEKHGALIIVHAMDLPAKFSPKMHADFGADQPGRTGDQEGFHKLKAEMPKVEI